MDWKEAWTFEDYVISLYKRHQTHSAEFQTLTRIYGQKKLQAIWDKHTSNILKQHTLSLERAAPVPWPPEGD